MKCNLGTIGLHSMLLTQQTINKHSRGKQQTVSQFKQIDVLGTLKCTRFLCTITRP